MEKKNKKNIHSGSMAATAVQCRQLSGAVAETDGGATAVHCKSIKGRRVLKYDVAPHRPLVTIPLHSCWYKACVKIGEYSPDLDAIEHSSKFVTLVRVGRRSSFSLHECRLTLIGAIRFHLRRQKRSPRRLESSW